MSSSSIKGSNNKRVLTSASGYLINIDVVQDATANGRAYTMSHLYTIPANAKAYFLLDTPTHDISFQTTMTCANEMVINTYLNPTTDTLGEYVEAVNRNTKFPNNNTIRAYYAPTLSALGAHRITDLLSTGSRSGATSTSVATILGAGHRIVYEVENISNNTAKASISTTCIIGW